MLAQKWYGAESDFCDILLTLDGMGATIQTEVNQISRRFTEDQSTVGRSENFQL